MIPSIYINLDDDVSNIFERIKREHAQELILVCPKRCFLFNDSINLRLLKKQTDMVKKTIHILTMDERGQNYAKDAGFSLKFLPKVSKSGPMSDIGSMRDFSKQKKPIVSAEPKVEKKNIKAEVVKEKVAEHKIVNTAVTTAHAFQLPKVEVSDNIFANDTVESLKQDKKGKSLWKIILFFLILSAGVVLVLFTYILPKGEVVIYPKSETLIRDLEITSGLAIQAPDATKLIVPGSKVEDSVLVTQKFDSKGKKEVGSKAGGFVRIYNFTKLPLNLKASTTTFKLAGKSYVLLADINALKPTLYKNAKTKEIDTESLGGPFEIIATEGGEEANAPGDTRIEITNQVLGSKPQVVYAKTEGPLTGGTSRYLSFVSETDIEESKKSLNKIAFEKIQEKLKSKNLSLAESGYVVEVLNFTTNKPVGSESPNFEASLEAKFTGLAINSKDLNQLVVDRIKQTLADNKTLELSENLDQAVFKYKEIDPKFEFGILSVHFQGKVWYNLKDNLNFYPNEFKGKTPEEVNEILSKDMEIERVDITVAPSWQKTFPKMVSNISIKVEKSQ